MNTSTQLDDRPQTIVEPLHVDPYMNRVYDLAVKSEDDTYVCRPAKHALTQAELQFLREEIRVLIKSYAEMVALGKKVAHHYHEAATPDTEEGVAYFEKHSKVRTDLLFHKKSLRKFENIQRKIRIQLGQSAN